MTGYGVHRSDGLPGRVELYEVGPRDGLQNEDALVPTDAKVELVHRLASAGLGVIEAASFVHPRWVPQMADAGGVVDALHDLDGLRLPVLVPNLAGLRRALDHGVRDIAVFVSATETFSRKNLNCTVEESMQAVEAIVNEVPDGVSIRGYVSMCFGDPWEGQTPLAPVVAARARLRDLGCYQVSLGDTIGVATPGHVEALLEALGDPADLAVHFHDTYGQALSNTLTSLRAGVTTIDASVGGLGGCPFAHSATGNLATEDLVWMLNGLGIETGVDLEALTATSNWIAAHLGRPSPSRVVRALTSTGDPT